MFLVNKIIPLDMFRSIWEFFQKLPFQELYKEEFIQRNDFANLLDGDITLTNTNAHRFHYYLSIIQDLCVQDPYYWKLYEVLSNSLT